LPIGHAMETNPPDKARAATRTHFSLSDQLPSLTSLRGVAALWVVIYHYSVQCFPALDVTDYTHIFHKGYLAVDMFFMLSGFVLTHVYHRKLLDDVSGNYRGFMIARIARIYPLHVLILLLFVATAVAANWSGDVSRSLEKIPLQGSGSVSAFFANIFLVQGLDAGKLSWNYPSWSISVEFMAYLLFPVVLPVIWRANTTAKWSLACLLVGLLGLFAYIAQDNFDQWDGSIVLLRCFPEFLLGSLLYSAFRIAPTGIGIERDGTIFGIILITLACLHFGAADLLVTLLFALLILAAVRNTGRFSRWANVKALVWLGDISYSIYLIHSFVQDIGTKLLGRFGLHKAELATLSPYKSLALMVPMLVLCLVAAHLSYYCFEVRSRRYVRDLLGSESKSKTWAWLKAEPRRYADLQVATARRATPPRPSRGRAAY
jgi:peptidoglycan/LPS O-acetylase OafA/YrhL